MRALLLVAWVASGSACLRTTEFKCMQSPDCSASGAVCESNGYCSFIDSECPSGRRYGELSGDVANQCVGGGGGDGGVDTMTTDTPPAGCPAGYAMISGGGTHLYKVIATGSWSSRRDVCAGDSPRAYLAVPSDMTELQALVTAGNAASLWVGISDSQVEGSFRTVLDQTFSATDPMWDSGEPNNAANRDCVQAKMSSSKLAMDTCGTSYPAVCECEP